jgi:hypothetical protein
MDLEVQDWYEALLEDCKAIVVEYGFISRWSLVEGYHELGKRILQENHNFDRQKIYGQQIVKKVSETLGMSERTLQYAIQFSQKYPELESLPMGKNISWSKVVKELLPENPKPIEKKKHICPNCHFQF